MRIVLLYIKVQQIYQLWKLELNCGEDILTASFISENNNLWCVIELSLAKLYPLTVVI